MNADQLRALQAPLKEKYKQDPASALVTLRAEGKLSEDVACKIQTGKSQVEAGLHPATGGDGTQACSSDMLLEALAGCAGVTMNAVATALGLQIKEAKVIVEGDLDFRGTLGVSKEAPVGFKSIRLKFDITSSEPAEKIQKLKELTERYCVVFQTLTHPPRIETQK